MIINCSDYKMVCSKRLCRVLYDIICIVQLGVVRLSCWNFWFVFKIDEDQWMYDSIMSEEVDMDDQNEQRMWCEWTTYWLFGCVQYFSCNNVHYCY